MPFGDANGLRLPGEPGDAWEDDFVLLADAFPTDYHATGIIDVAPGDTAVVFGAGLWGYLRYIPRVFAERHRYTRLTAIPEWLDKAGELGFIPINFIGEDTG